MIYYKVVKKDNTSCFMNSQKYVKKYLPGTIVKADEKTLGIFCFKDIISIKKFCCPYYYKIFRVHGIGKPSIPDAICSNSKTKFMNSFYKGNIPLFKVNIIKTSMIPNGTICFPAVEVLDEVIDF